MRAFTGGNPRTSMLCKVVVGIRECLGFIPQVSVATAYLKSRRDVVAFWRAAPEKRFAWEQRMKDEGRI